MSQPRVERRGAVKCCNCGVIRVAELLSNEDVRVLGSKEACACGDAQLRVLE